ncbi:50S ribosomal protein L2 [Cerasicoccus arenae]|uniref:Large ribosomal subunit protein uL2 n=1 Tax=Cerasicoccus arenae TaxID=424488 RepID=A0A8J3GEF1_9BACT|nr:50S ribosomal protein L2 [Cerasicoccus arenae]MBK1857332.1 50S ribosomal protein L2 [Cerasicoccus arenae]GHC08809.1 50S ribosomal protein L2 [Cerasicoccus arenae]
MPLVTTNPTTPSLRFRVQNKQDVAPNNPEKTLTQSRHRAKGRNCYGRITTRHRGGGHKRLYRQIDFKREKLEMPATVQTIEYDPNRSANIALVKYEDGELRYVLACRGMKVGDTILNTNEKVEEFTPGLCLQLRNIPPATFIHAIEMQPGQGARIARSAGQSAQLISLDGNYATLKMPSGEIRKLHSSCRATIGRVGNEEHGDEVIGKAGRTRWKGIRPTVRGMAMNPVDHPNGGGEGRSKSGGGRQHPCSPWGQLSKGFPTRKKSKTSNALIVVRRNGRKMKKR